MDHPLTEAFRKARKQYTLFAGLLIAWELVGLRLPEDGRISTTIDVELLSPNAAPFVLIALIVYFAFRTELEWRYCSPTPQHSPIARLDYWSSHGIAVAALLLFGVQRSLEVQLYGGDWYVAVATGTFMGTMTVGVVRFWQDRWRGNRPSGWLGLYGHVIGFGIWIGGLLGLAAWFQVGVLVSIPFWTSLVLSAFATSALLRSARIAKPTE